MMLRRRQTVTRSIGVSRWKMMIMRRKIWRSPLRTRAKKRKGEEITTSLVDSSIRETLLDDLEELICFLTQRTNELKESELRIRR